MRFTDIPVAGWWFITLAVTAVYFGVLVPWMPTPRTRLRISLGPVICAAGYLGLFATQRYSGPEMMAAYSCLVLAFPLAIAWDHKKLAELALDQQKNGNTLNNVAPAGMLARMLLVFTCAILVDIWILVRNIL